MARARRKPKIKTEKKAAPRDEPLVNPFAAAHGAYEQANVVDLDGSLGGKRMSMVKVMLNRGGTAVDRWIANDKVGLFGEPQQAAIRHCRMLWHRADGGLCALNPAAVRVDTPQGLSQHEALTELARMKESIPRRFWDVFENVCRFDEEAGAAGSRLASNGRSAIDAAKLAVAYTASLLAMKFGFR